MILQCVKWAAVAFREGFITWQPSVSNVLMCLEHNNCQWKQSHVTLSVPGEINLHVDKQLAIFGDCVTVCCHILDTVSNYMDSERWQYAATFWYWQHTVSNYRDSERWQYAATFWTLSATTGTVRGDSMLPRSGHCQQLQEQWEVTVCCHILDTVSNYRDSERRQYAATFWYWQHTVSNYTEKSPWKTNSFW